MGGTRGKANHGCPFVKVSGVITDTNRDTRASGCDGAIREPEGCDTQGEAPGSAAEAWAKPRALPCARNRAEILQGSSAPPPMPVCAKCQMPSGISKGKN